jgi:single-strand DNA-binding protein
MTEFHPHSVGGAVPAVRPMARSDQADEPDGPGHTDKGMTMSMNAASVTLVGRAAAHPQVSVGSTGDRVSLRVVATERYFDKAVNDWVSGDEFGVTVVCWRTLGTAVLTTVRKGDPVIVSGRIATRRFEKNGTTQYFTEVKADFVGLDLAKAGARFTRNPMEPRESAEPSTPTVESEQPTVELGADRPLVEPFEPGDADDYRAPWEAEDDQPGGRNGELVAVD